MDSSFDFSHLLNFPGDHPALDDNLAKFPNQPQHSDPLFSNSPFLANEWDSLFSDSDHLLHSSSFNWDFHHATSSGIELANIGEFSCLFWRVPMSSEGRAVPPVWAIVLGCRGIFIDMPLTGSARFDMGVSQGPMQRDRLEQSILAKPCSG